MSHDRRVTFDAYAAFTLHDAALLEFVAAGAAPHASADTSENLVCAPNVACFEVNRLCQSPNTVCNSGNGSTEINPGCMMPAC